jgi:hypothetical protein
VEQIRLEIGFPTPEQDQGPRKANSDVRLISVVEGVQQGMERFLGALSITLLLSGWAVVTQFQNPQYPVTQVVQTELSASHPVAPSEVFLDRSKLVSILVRALQFNRPQAENSLFDRSQHAGSSRQVSVVPLQAMSPLSEACSDIQTVLHDNMPQYRQGRLYLDQGITRARAFSLFTQP